MRIVHWAVLILGLAVSGLASANVIYRWETVSTSPTIWAAVGEIEITDAAWAAGGLSYTAPPHCAYASGAPNCDNSNPSSPIILFNFAVNTSAVSGVDIMLNLINGTGMLYPYSHWFSASLSIVDDIMTGGIYANTGNSDALISNSIAFNSDYNGRGCGTTGVCQGATGYWRQVPEPASLAMLSLGLLGLAVRRRIVRPNEE